MKKTPINEVHKELNGRLIDFGGWELPVQYTSIIEEHNAVRNSAGLFDVSHMGEILIKGNDSTKYINYIITNDISNMANNKIMYSPMCYKEGGCVDDLLVYKKTDVDYLIVVNASNIEKDFEWMLSQKEKFDVSISNKSEEYAQIALQGPNSEKILNKIADAEIKDITFFTFKEDVVINGVKALVSRTGYTGEDGFEIYLEAANGGKLFKDILEVGKEDGLIPCGLGARDTLRFESALPLYGHELSKNITPIEAGLKYFVKPEKNEFNGKDTIKEQYENKPPRRIVGFEMVDKGIARNEYIVYNENEEEIGYVTSGSFSPSLNKNLGLALIKRKYAKKETNILIGVRKKKLRAVIVKKPFYNKKYKK